MKKTKKTENFEAAIKSAEHYHKKGFQASARYGLLESIKLAGNNENAERVLQLIKELSQTGLFSPPKLPF